MLLDPRGPRFAAAITSVVLVLIMIFSAGWLALAQAAVFAVAAVAPRYSPYGLVYRTVLAPRLPRPTELMGAPLLGLVFTAFALLAAFLNAAFGLCLGCEVYLAWRRLSRRPLASRVPAPEN